jgi:adenylate cyclase
MERANERRCEEDKILLCIGIGHGRILRIGDTDVYGAQVNAASKLGEDLARAGDIFVTDALRLAAGELDGVSYEPLEFTVPGSEKNHAVRYQ